MNLSKARPEILKKPSAFNNAPIRKVALFDDYSRNIRRDFRLDCMPANRSFMNYV
jgi:hypothetical protein